MDYTQASVRYKLRKVVRYFKLYGLSKTFAKVRAQYHLKAKIAFSGDSWENPKCKVKDDPRRNVAIIGCGAYAYSIIGHYLAKNNSRFLVSAYDVNKARARSLVGAYAGAQAVATVSQIIDDPRVKIVYIASNHATHADYAVECLKAGKHVHIEKPHVVSVEQLRALHEAMNGGSSTGAKVGLGFNRPQAPLFTRLMHYLSEESGPTTVNWFVAGHQIDDDHWYFKEEEGGRVLGNLCHWLDLSVQIVGLDRAFPVTVVPLNAKGAKSDFGIMLLFNDESLGVISFSAKGHTFEGVREVLNCHRGSTLAALRDFQELIVDSGEKKRKFNPRVREHGHENNILRSYRMVDGASGESLFQVVSSAELFLSVKTAIDTGERVVCNPTKH